MKYALMAALAVTSAMSGISLAQDRQPILVESKPGAVTHWAAGISRDLEKRLRAGDAMTVWEMTRRQPATGIVSVLFKCGEDGKPSDVVLSRRSGMDRLDRSALRAVAAINSLNPLPSRLSTGQKIQANIFFADGEDMFKRQIKQLRRETSANLAAGKGDPEVLALNFGLRVPG